MYILGAKHAFYDIIFGKVLRSIPRKQHI